MNILLADAKGILCEKQRAYAKNRLSFSLLRFEHRINGASMHFFVDENCERVKCSINVNIEGVGIVSVSRSGVSYRDVLSLAVDAIEPKVAYRVDWRMWFNADTFATWILSVSQPVKWIFGLDRPLSQWPLKHSGILNKSANARGNQRKRLSQSAYGLGSGRSGTFST
jgi:hypothetical protein